MAFQDWPLVGKFFILVIPGVMLAAALLLVCIALELIAARDDVKRNRWFGALVHATYPVVAGLVVLPFRLIRNTFDVPALVDITALTPAIQVACVLIYVDFLRYWEHRFEHRFFWPVHSVHHSQTDLHAANGYGHPLQSLSDLLVISIPLSLIETDASTPTLLATILAFQVFFIHAPIRWHFGPLRHVFVDGPYHRIHHSIEPRHFGKNFSIVLTVWDRLFGTSHFPAKDEWPDTGVEGIDPPRNFGDYLARPFNQLAWGPFALRRLTRTKR